MTSFNLTELEDTMSKDINLTALAKGSHAYATHNIRKLDTKDIILLTSFALIFLVGVSGNALVCYIFNKQTMRLSTMELLMVILAAADLFSSFFNPLMFTYWTVTIHKAWHFGDFGCKLLPSLTRISVSFTFGIILIITIDRCIVICFPFKRALKRYEVHLLVMLSLLLSVLTELPYTIHQEVNPMTTCQVPDSTIPGFIYPFVIFSVSRAIFFVAIFSTTVFLIYRTLYDKEHVTTMKHQKHVQKTKKIMQMLVTMAITFFLLVYPREILHITFNFSWLSPPGIAYTKEFLDINSFLKVLHMCNSICNVFIYSRLHGKFRRRSKKFFKHMFQGESYDKTVWMNGTFSEGRDFYGTNSFRNKSIYRRGDSPIKFAITRIHKDKWIQTYSKLILENLKDVEFNRETIL